MIKVMIEYNYIPKQELIYINRWCGEIEKETGEGNYGWIRSEIDTFIDEVSDMTYKGLMNFQNEENCDVSNLLSIMKRTHSDRLSKLSNILSEWYEYFMSIYKYFEKHVEKLNNKDIEMAIPADENLVIYIKDHPIEFKRKPGELCWRYCNRRNKNLEFEIATIDDVKEFINVKLKDFCEYYKVRNRDLIDYIVDDDFYDDPPY